MLEPKNKIVRSLELLKTYRYVPHLQFPLSLLILPLLARILLIRVLDDATRPLYGIAHLCDLVLPLANQISSSLPKPKYHKMARK